MMSNSVKRSEWTPLTIDKLPMEFRLALGQSRFEVQRFREWVCAQFFLQVGFHTNEIYGDTQRLVIAQRWWAYQHEKGDIAFRRHAVLQPILFGSISEKVSTIAQRACYVCKNGVKADAQFPRHVIPLRIPPKSRQSLDRMNWSAFQAAIKSRVVISPIAGLCINSLCIAITFALSQVRKDRDLDNMAKAVLDAISRACGFDDAAIQHLDLIKIVEDFPEEYLIIRMAPSNMPAAQNVILPLFDSIWDQPVLNLSDFHRSD